MTGRDDRPGRLLALLRRPPARQTNLTLLLALLLAFATGIGAVASGTAGGRWVVIAHGVVAIMVVLLVPWKSLIIRRGLRRARPDRWAAVLLAALTTTALVAGIGHTTGLLRSVGGVLAMWLHIAAALALAPLVAWHVTARRVRPRAADLSRRAALRTGGLAAVAGATYLAAGSAVAAAGLPGAGRRFTGSYEAGSFRPAGMPATIWLDDSVPAIDRGTWRLTVVDAAGARRLTANELAGEHAADRLRAVLDCTSGWYAEQDWTGVTVSALLRGTGEARSLYVHSTTGYGVRFPLSDAGRLLLAYEVGGAPLSRGHGYPLRLVAPGRRGFWWVKWVDRIELHRAPWWWQPPFPVT